MRAFPIVAIVLSTSLLAGCSESAPPVTDKQAEPKSAGTAQPEPVPADVPIPIGLEGRKDSALPGTKFHVVQGQLPSTLQDAVAAVKQQAESAGWKPVGEPAPNESAMTLVFEKEARSLKVTLVKAQNTVTSMNMLTGPK